MADIFPKMANLINNIKFRFLNNSFLIYSQSGYRKKVEFGLMSGIKVTSVFGTIINSAICKSICEILNVNFDYMLALGDDLDLQVDSVSDAEKVLNKYKEIGIEVSKQKTSISFGAYHKSEFLRNVYYKDSLVKVTIMMGYPM